MAAHDKIGDFLTAIRNAVSARKPNMQSAHSNLRLGIANILKAKGYITDVKESKDDRNFPVLQITLKYHGPRGETPAIQVIQRYSKPGRRLYFGCTEIPRILGGMGTAILTTSKGILSDDDARRKRLGGELLCQVW